MQGQVRFQQVQQGFQRLASQHASEKFEKKSRVLGIPPKLIFFEELGPRMRSHTRLSDENRSDFVLIGGCCTWTGQGYHIAGSPLKRSPPTNQARSLAADWSGALLLTTFFFRPTPSRLPPGRSTCFIACCKLGLID